MTGRSAVGSQLSSPLLVQSTSSVPFPAGPCVPERGIKMKKSKGIKCMIPLRERREE